MTTHHPVTVVGAGLGGLTLARVLHVHGVPAVVHDLDATPAARDQGGMLDIHEESGQAALRAAGLYDGFLGLTLPGGQAMRILDERATVHREEGDDGTGTRPEVERGRLRDLLLDALPAGTVRWGARLTAVRALAGGRHELTFADGSTTTTDLLVGADGAWSKVRPLVSAAEPAYTGFSAVESDLLDADARHPDAAATVGGGLMFALGEGRGFLAHREFHGTLHVYAVLRVAEEWLAGVDLADAAAAKAAVLERFAGWDERLRRLVGDADGPLVPRPIHALPIGHRWPRVPGVTLLGDAAHVMSPFAGEGANLAMLDGAELARAVVAHADDVEGALSAYEEAMFPRAAEKAAEAAANLDLCFGPDAPQALVDRFASFDRATAAAG